MTIIDKERFDTADLRDAKFLIGRGIQHNVKAGTILLTQDTYPKAVLDKFGMADARPAKTPAESEAICAEKKETMSPEDTTLLRSATGSVLYLSRCTRPDITNSVMVLTRSISKPGPKAMSKLKRVLRYLKRTASIGIIYSDNAKDGDKLTTYVDSDNAGDQEKEYSTTGVVLCLADGPVYKANGGGHLYSRSRIRRHVQGVCDHLTLTELDEIEY